MITLKDLYAAFLAIINTDEWDTWDDWERESDWGQLLLAAIPWFKFPRCSLEYDQTHFLDDKMSNNEVQVLVRFMKYAWYGRVIDSWENIRPMYQERDFSPAKQMGEFSKRMDTIFSEARRLEATYYRSINGKPFPYSKLAGG